MGAFFSGTDKEQLDEGVNDEGFYYSLVVSTKPGKEIAFGFSYLDQYRNIHREYIDKFDVSINIDLSELRGYNYHTGMIYTAFVPNEGKGIAFGGRYDDIGSAFGKARPASGFSTDVKQLLELQNISEDTPDKIFAPVEDID